MGKTFFPDSTQLDTLNGHLNDISVTLGGQNVLTRENLISLLGYEPVKPEGNYELIESITVSDDTTTVIERTQEPDGTAYDFKKVIVKYAIPQQAASTSNYLATRFNNQFFVWSQSPISSSGKTYCWHQVWIENGLYRQLVVNASIYGGSMATLVGPSYDAVKNTASASISRIQPFISGDRAFPSGTKIDIYAVRS